MNMVIIKTADLIWPALDWAVAKAAGFKPVTFPVIGFYLNSPPDNVPVCGYPFNPSIDWRQGGLLIEQWDIQLSSTDDEPGHPRRWNGHRDGSSSGPTPLIAACRAIVAAKLGGEVRVPAELMEGA